MIIFDHICRNHNPQHKSWCWSIVIVTVDHICHYHNHHPQQLLLLLLLSSQSTTGELRLINCYHQNHSWSYFQIITKIISNNISLVFLAFPIHQGTSSLRPTKTRLPREIPSRDHLSENCRENGWGGCILCQHGKLYQVLGGTKAKRLHNLSCKERTEVSKIEFEKLLWQKFSFVSIFP